MRDQPDACTLSPRRAIVLSMRSFPFLLVLSACSGCSDSELGSSSVQSTTLPSVPAPIEGGNLVLISLDTVRADHLACYGYFRQTTPNLDEFAQQSLLFERCIAPMSTTLPSHTSMFTGVWPIEHGVMANIKKAEVYVRNARLLSLAEVLQGGGYDTGAFIAAFPLRAQTGLQTGFDVYGDIEDDARERSAEDVTDEALSWLGDRDQTPFFLWVHYFDPHTPYEEHPETGTFETSEVLQEWLVERAFTLRAHRELVKRGNQGRIFDAFEAANLYDGELRYMDHHLGRLLDALRAREGWDQTVVAVIGDHGDGLNQHGLPGHGYIWAEQLLVPFLLRVPGMEPGRFEHVNSVVDLTATLISRLVVDAPAEFRSQLRGVDLLAEGFKPRPVVATTSARKERTDNLEETSIISERWQYIRRGTMGASLFDLVADPYELRDVSVLYPDVCEELDALLASQLAGQASRGGGHTRPATQQEIDALRALGYGGGDEEGDDY